MTTPAFAPITLEVLRQLQEILGSAHVSVARADLDLHARDQSHHHAALAEVVVWPTEAEQVAAVLKLANAQHIAVTPWGVGTGLEGNAIPLHGGILMSFEQMDKILKVHADDFQVTVQPGIGHKDLNAQLARYGLFFPPDPGANASIGGMLANNAAGIRTVKYGATKDNVLRMQVALANGTLIQVGSRSIKQSSGYDLLHLFVGSEGTLGVITEATLKLTPIAAYMSAVVVAFESVAAAIETVVAVRGSGLDPAALEFVDAAHCKMLSTAENVDLDEKPTLFMEFHAASQPALEYGLEMVREICVEMGALSVKATSDPTERKQLWYARHASYEILTRNSPGIEYFINDVAVPLSAYPAMVGFIEDVKAEYKLTAYMIGHAGDGNIHVDIPFTDQASYDQALHINGLIVRKALSLEGTSTGEHGVGIGKTQFMVEEHGAALDTMRLMKRSLDPNGILNPGKVLPD